MARPPFVAFTFCLIASMAGAPRAELLGARPQPAAAGLDPARLAPLRSELQRYVDQHQMAGAVAVIGRRGHLGSIEAVGFQDLEKKTPLRADAVFRIASMTKIATTVAVMMLEDEGKFSVDDPLEKHLPEFRGQLLVQSRSGKNVTLVPAPRPITIKDLLTHTSGLRCDLPAGLGELRRKNNLTLAEAVMAISQQPLETPPGTVWKYCGAGFDTLGRLVEVASGKPFDQFLEERLFRVLHMTDTTFNATAAQRARMAVLYRKEGEGLARSDRGQPSQGPAPGERVKYPTPSGGLYSTAADQAKLYQMLLDRGTAGGRRLLKEETVAKMTRVHFSAPKGVKVGFTPGLGMGLGVQVVMEPTGVTEMLSPGTFGHGGAFGTQGWMDPRREMFFILMVQRQGFGDGDALPMRKTVQAVGAAAAVDGAGATPKGS
jgi:CubicO group peptidase (beta-lactamase class C family)